MSKKALRLEDLEVSQDARTLVRHVYGLITKTSFGGCYPLRDQLLKAAISSVSNIAEGFERDGDREFAQFLSQARGSCGEIRARLYLAADLGLADIEVIEDLIGEAVRVSRRIARLISYPNGSGFARRKFWNTERFA
jgi:four helix bundle protein